MFTQKNRAEDVLRSIIKNWETLTKQINTKPQETLDIQLTQPREVFSCTPSIILGLGTKWMIGFTSLEVQTCF